jgi:hypothetical protein
VSNVDLKRPHLGACRQNVNHKNGRKHAATLEFDVLEAHLRFAPSTAEVFVSNGGGLRNEPFVPHNKMTKLKNGGKDRESWIPF